MHDRYAETPTVPPTEITLALEPIIATLDTVAGLYNLICHDIVDMRGGSASYRVEYCDGVVPRMTRTLYR